MQGILPPCSAPLDQHSGHQPQTLGMRQGSSVERLEVPRAMETAIGWVATGGWAWGSETDASRRVQSHFSLATLVAQATGWPWVGEGEGLGDNLSASLVTMRIPTHECLASSTADDE